MSLEARIVGILVGAVALLLLWWGWQATRVHASIAGLESGVALQPQAAEDLEFRIEVSPKGRLDEATLTFNGRDVLPDAEVKGDVISWDPGELEEGEYRLRLTVPRPILPDAAITWDFTVDGTPPRILVPSYLPPRGMDADVEIEGTVEGATELLVNGERQNFNGDGEFTLDYDAPPTGPIVLKARDAAGNERSVSTYAPVKFPDAVRGVHVTAIAWHNDSLREGIIDLIDEGLVNTVVLSIKDEGGVVGHATKVPLARRIGASANLYRLEDVVDYLHSRKVRVTGRIVAFRDPVLADWSWSNRRREMVVQTEGGGRFGAYGGGFTNFANADVQAYNLALAEEAVRAGVDDILWDYIRRPDGEIADMRFPGLKGEPEDEVTGFLAQSHSRLRKLGAVQGASVFGIAATRPEQIAQNVLEMAGHTDYIAPMLYPSHWNVGEYGLSDPEQEPYEIIKRSMGDFRQQVQRTGRPLVPWIQHFSLDVRYGSEDVVAQTRAARDMGFNGWLMWDPDVTYDAKALAGSAD